MNQTASPNIVAIQQCIPNTAHVLFAVPVGSRANNTQTEKSDWYIADQWRYGPALDRIGKHETMRHRAGRKDRPDRLIQ